MKKNHLKKFVCAVALCAVAGFACEWYHSKSQESSALLENVESLSEGEFGLYYRTVTGSCPFPVEYKRWTKCELGGNDWACLPSDC